MRSAGVLASALFASFAASCGESGGAPAPEAPAVLVERVVPARVRERIQATGELLAKARASVAAQVEGQVTRIRAEEGEAVATDQVIVEIDPERHQLEHQNAEAQLAEAEAGLAELERELDRIAQLHREGAASNARLDEAQTQVRLGRARRDAAAARRGVSERAVRDSSVTSPFAGLLERRFVNEGEFVSVGGKLFEVVALDPLEVEFRVAERDSARVEQGAALAIRVTPYPEESFPATVSVVAPTIDPLSRTLRVRGAVPNADARLRPGLFARVELEVGERAGVPMISREAVLQRADGSVVFRLRGRDRVERRLVRLGAFQGDRVEVVEGLGPGDWIVVRGQSGLSDGALVSLRDAQGRPLPTQGVGSPAFAVGAGPGKSEATP